jgi:hypothetical protein
MTGLAELADIAKPIVQTASRLIEKLAGRPCEIAGEMLADQLYMWQWQQRIRIFHRAEKVMEREGIAARTLPSGFLIPLLAAAGNIEDETLQEMWSNLIASAAESDAGCEPSFIETLKGLSVREARLLQAIARKKFVAVSVVATSDVEVDTNALPEEQMVSLGFADSEEFWSAATRLQSLGVLVLTPVAQRSILRDEDGGLGLPVSREVGKATQVQICFTRFGARFYSKASREDVIDDSITDPWVGMSSIREMAMEAGRAASAAITMEEVENQIHTSLDERSRYG